ncbi:MAG: NADH:flavin oxidoreductase/NADH oxidase [Rhodospirillaceae bacterium]|nr:NADH:flavin oxidoreductase/NADH oxidase [Rhodospirillaceae bacterium]
MSSPPPMLFSPFKLRELAVKNRLCISPMCTYSAVGGFVSDWHLVHLGQHALGGAGIIFVEATAVEERGRITHSDTGLWDDKFISPLARIASFLRSQGVAPAIQLAHAGCKASAQVPWRGASYLSEVDAQTRGEQSWATVSSTAQPLDSGWHTPHALTIDEIGDVVSAWRAAAERAKNAGFDIVEIHAAHGYLLHQFLSPLLNKRADGYGGDREGRMRLTLEVVETVRDVWPKTLPVFVRLSAVDGAASSWTLEDSVVLAKELKARGVDVVDCSSGGLVGSGVAREVEPFGSLSRDFGFQVPYAARIRNEAGVATMAVGLIVDPHHAERILQEGQADIIAIARSALFHPYWMKYAARTLQNERAFESWPTEYGFWLEKWEPVVERLRGRVPNDVQPSS